MNGFLIVNPRSGDGGLSSAELARRARDRGIGVHVLAEGDDLAALARSAQADVIGMAGGDGSLAVVAEAASELGSRFVCVPFGTRNHFARDLGLDRDDPVGALAAFDEGREVRVDLVRVNGRAFLNNASLGLYADLVDHRERRRRRGAALARLRALARLAQHRRPLPLVLDGRPVNAYVLMIGNNAYSLAALELGTRPRLDEGLLHVYLAGALVTGGWSELPPRPELLVESHAGSLTVALDGEPARLASPLRFAVAPGALRVLVPGSARAPDDTRP